MKRYLEIGSASILGLIIGISIDRIVKGYPFFKWDNQVNVISLLSLVISIVIAFLIPFSVSKIIEDKRIIKMFFIDEFKQLIDISAKVNSIIAECYSRSDHNIEPADKDRIIYHLHLAELKLSSINQQLESVFHRKSADIEKKLTSSYIDYDRNVSGGELMNSDFYVVDTRFLRESQNEFSKFETAIKTTLQNVQSL